MKRRVFAALLALALALAGPALGAEKGQVFSDVEGGSWYAEGVAVCVEEGLMEGVGDGRFAPEVTLSQAEALVMALRLYDLCHGGDGVLERAPEAWGKVSMTFSNGTVRTGYIDDAKAWVRGNPSSLTGHKPYLGVSLDTAAELDWGAALDGQPARVDYEGMSFPGVTRLLKSVYPTTEEDALVFYMTKESLSLEWNDIVRDDPYNRPGPQAWYRDAAYFLDRLIEGGAVPENFAPGLFFDAQKTATRLDFARALAGAGVELPAINQVEDIPDCNSDDILTLYRAGVLTGVDETGAFGGEGSLTRAEAAVICARVLKPELRVRIVIDRSMTVFQEDGLYGFYGEDGTVAVPARYTFLVLEDDGCLVATDQRGNKGILDTEGQVIVPFLYPRIYNSPDELGFVVVGTAGSYASPLHYNGKKGMIDGTGKVVIPLVYGFLSPFENGRASFAREADDGFIYGHLLPDGTEVSLRAEEVPEDDPLHLFLVLSGLIQSEDA